MSTARPRARQRSRTARPDSGHRAGSPALLLRCPPGVARVLEAEMRHTGVAPRGTRTHRLWQRNHDLLFLPKPPRMPGTDELRVAEEVHRPLVFGRYKISARQLDDLAAALGKRGKRWRLAVSVDGTHFNRFDMARWLSKELSRRRLRVDDHAPATAFVFCVDEAYYVCVRERDTDGVAGRKARTAERAGSLPPPVAAAMAFLGRPADNDTILDPVCGSGTLLAEAEAYAPGAVVHGTDSDPQAVKTARRNLRHVPEATVERADARALDLADGSVTLTLANVPFGKQFGDVDGTAGLTSAILAEQARLAAPEGWRGVVLAADADTLRDAAGANGLTLTRHLDVRVRGESAVLGLLHRR